MKKKEGIRLNYVHLQVFTAYSLLKSVCKIEALVQKAAAYQYEALAITDIDVMYGVIPFYKECKKHGIKPIIGLTLTTKTDNSVFPLVLLAKNNEGYQQLLKLSSLAKTTYEQGVPKELVKKYAEHVIAISPFHGEILHYIQANEIEAAIAAMREWKTYFQDDFYISIEKRSDQKLQQAAQTAMQLCEQHHVSIVAGHRVHYIDKNDHSVYECLQAIERNTKLSPEDEQKPSYLYDFKGKEEMRALFRDDEQALQNTAAIALQCNVQLEFGQRTLPKFPVPASMTSDEYLQKLCEDGVKKRYKQPSETVYKRLYYELSIIKKMNFSDYFLIVWDFMKYAHEHGIMTGPGRGSAAGSLVAYVLFITGVDPLKHELLFERFLNPERVSMPDIDIDFSDVQREKVIKYVAEKYGKKHVAQIITFGTLAAKASVRDVGRVLGIPNGEIDRISKLIPAAPGTMLKDAIQQTAELKKLIQENPSWKKLFTIALKIEGLPRHTSTHAAGVVISKEPLVHTTAVQNGHDGIYLTQFSMELLEELGLLKMDFLGLRNLTLIENICRMISIDTKRRFNIHDVPMDDSRTFQLLSKGDTAGVFQLESDGMKKVLQQLKPSHFEDIVAVNALYRPGPMENIPTYIKRKHGIWKVQYPHPALQPILQKTYGVIVYQEQIMQIASKMAGFTLGEADILRRAVSKKNRDVLDKERAHFVSGCLKNGYDENTANAIYDLIVRFANYGFNRSHAVAYSVIAYQLAYLKANYPLYFFTAILTSVVGNEEKVAAYVREAKRNQIEILPPSINKSHYHFQIEQEAIRYSFAAIKNVGIAAIKAIVEERKKAPFQDLFDFCARVPTRVVNRRVIESLIAAGCFDEFAVNRATLLASIDVALDYVDIIGEDSSGFILDEEIIPKPQYVDVPELELLEKLQMEKEVLGFFLTSHPIYPYKRALAEKRALQVASLVTMKQYSQAVTGGYITNVKKIQTKKGEQMAFFTLSDETGEIEVVLFPKELKQYDVLLQKEQFVLIAGAISHRNGEQQLIANTIHPLKMIKVEAAQQLFLKVENNSKETLANIKTILQKYPGNTQVYLHYAMQKRTILLSGDNAVTPNETCLNELKQLLGADNVVLK